MSEVTECIHIIGACSKIVDWKIKLDSVAGVNNILVL